MQFLGEAFVRVAGLPLPGAIVGLLLMFIVLCLRRGVPRGLRESSAHILQHLMLLFVPIVAGIVTHADRIQREWLPFIASALGSVVITVAVTGLVFHWMLKRLERS